MLMKFAALLRAVAARLDPPAPPPPVVIYQPAQNSGSGIDFKVTLR